MSETLHTRFQTSSEGTKAAAKEHDARVKEALSSKKLLAHFVKYTLKEYHKLSIEEIVEEVIEPAASTIKVTDAALKAEYTWRPSIGFEDELLPDVRFTVRRRNAGAAPGAPQDNEPESPEEDSTGNGADSECAYFIYHADAGAEDTACLPAALYGRSIRSAATVLGPSIEITSDNRIRFGNISDVVLIWLIFSSDSSTQNRLIVSEAPSPTGVSASGTYYHDPDIDSGILELGVSPFREVFVFLGDPEPKRVEKASSFLHALDMLFFTDEDEPRRMKALKDYGLIRDAAEEDMAAAAALPYSLAYHYYQDRFHLKLQRRLQQVLSERSKSAAAAAELVVDLSKAGVYSKYADARDAYLSRIDPSDDFQSEAVSIFNSIWNRKHPDAAV